MDSGIKINFIIDNVILSDVTKVVVSEANSKITNIHIDVYLDQFDLSLIPALSNLARV